jgi:hypothetical protein
MACRIRLPAGMPVVSPAHRALPATICFPCACTTATLFEVARGADDGADLSVMAGVRCSATQGTSDHPFSAPITVKN